MLFPPSLHIACFNSKFLHIQASPSIIQRLFKIKQYSANRLLNISRYSQFLRSGGFQFWLSWFRWLLHLLFDEIAVTYGDEILLTFVFFLMFFVKLMVEFVSEHFGVKLISGCFVSFFSGFEVVYSALRYFKRPNVSVKFHDELVL